MSYIDPSSIILKPVVTERSISDQTQAKFAFYVKQSATKHQIAVAFKTLFNITPLKINTIAIPGKTKTDWRHRRPIQKPDTKKAVITLPKDTKIELLSLTKKK